MNGLKEIRDKMPETAAFLDDLCRAFGQSAVLPQVEKGLGGEPTFFAMEAGVRVGTRSTVHTSAIHWDEQGIARSTDAAWIVEARKIAERKRVPIRQYDPDKPGDVEREAKELRELIANVKAGKL